ncbi:unnamed protein product [Orchesella dallaii]|uniref:Uncharacterized protein n=1 Tax=Orchesella dallaii TaxID=48710 RepID=A0ABP1RTM1_9HEXA
MEGRNHRNQAKHAFLLLSLVTYSLAHVPNSYSSVNALESTSKEKESEFATNSMKSVDILKTANHDQIRNQPSSIQAKTMIEKQEDTVTDSMVQGSYEAFQKDENEVQITYSVPQAAAPAELKTMLPGIDDKALVNQVMSLMKTSKSNVDVITQAFRFVKLDAHLFTLLNQLSQMRESQDALQAESIKQQSKFDNVLEEIKSLGKMFN